MHAPCSLQFIDPANNLIKHFGKRVKVQKDFAVDEGGRKLYSLKDLPLNRAILDIGDQTIIEYSKIIEKSATSVLNGPMGKFEEPDFEKGTLEVFKAMSSSSGFTFLGGGDTGTALATLGFSPKDFSFVSLSGKASLKYLSGKKLVAIEELKNAKLEL